MPSAALDVAGAGRFRTGGLGPGISAGNSQALLLTANSNLDTVNLQYTNSGNANVWAMSYRQQTENGDFWIYQNESGADIKHVTLKYNAASVGINEVNPQANLHVSSGGAGILANLVVQSISGAKMAVTAYPTYGAVGTANNFPLALQINNSNVIAFDTSGNAVMPGRITAGSFGLSSSQFSIQLNSSRLYFYFGNTQIASLDSGGNLVTLGNVIPFGTP